MLNSGTLYVLEALGGYKKHMYKFKKRALSPAFLTLPSVDTLLYCRERLGPPVSESPVGIPQHSLHPRPGQQSHMARVSFLSAAEASLNFGPAPHSACR